MAAYPGRAIAPDRSHDSTAGSSTFLRQTLSKDEWDGLKPVIQRLYIEENHNFRMISTFLRDKYGFAPTRGQFDRKIAQWGFRKNAIKRERKSISGSTNGNAVIQDNSQRIKQTIPQRQEKQSQSSNGPDASEQEVTPDYKRDPLAIQNTDQQISHVVPQQTDCTITEPSVFPNTSNDHLTNTIIEHGDSSPWEYVDVPGSPKLSRLFEALDINQLAPVSPLSLSGPRAPFATDTTTYFRPPGLELMTSSMTQQENYSSRHFDVPGSKTLLYQQFGHARVSHPVQYSDNYEIYPLRDCIPPSPFNEIYPFPTLVQSTSQTHTTSVLSELSRPELLSHINRLQIVLTTFEQIIPKKSSMILHTMEQLAATYYACGNNRQSEEWWKKVVYTLKASEGFDSTPSPRRMAALVELYENMSNTVTPEIMKQDTSRAQEYKELEIELESHLTHGCSSIPELACDFLASKALRLRVMGHQVASERFARHLLQMALNNFGPRSIRSILAFGTLAKSIASLMDVETSNDMTKFKGSLHLSRTAVALFMEKKDILKGKGNKLATILLSVCRNMGEYQEAAAFGELLVKRSKELLGEHHPHTVNYLGELAATYQELGQYTRSVTIFQALLKAEEENSDLTTMRSILNRAWFKQQLGLAFRELNHYEKAILYFENMFWQDIDSSGPIDKSVKHNCWAFGDCYTQLQQYDSALDLYSRYKESIRGASNEDHPWITEIQGWIDNTYKLIWLQKELEVEERGISDRSHDSGVDLIKM